MRFRPLILVIVVSCMLGMWSVASAAVPVPKPANEIDPSADGKNNIDPSLHEGSSGAAPSSTPTVAHSQLDSEPIRRGGDNGATTSPLAPHPQGMELPRVAGALAIVISLIFALRWAGKKFFVPMATGKSTRAVQVLARSAIAPRQHITLLRIGRRVLVVGEAGSQMNSLSEITDPDEIAALLGQLQDDKSRLPTRAFQNLFARARSEMGGDEEMAEADATDSEISDEHEEAPHVDPAISGTREDITGLMDKIRVMSKHFRGGPA